MKQPWEGDDLPSGEWMLELPEDLPGGLGLSALTRETSRDIWWAVFLWDGTEATILSVHRRLDDAWPSLAVAYFCWTYVEAEVTAEDVAGVWSACVGARSQAEMIERAQAWIQARFSRPGGGTAQEWNLAAMPTPKQFH